MYVLLNVNLEESDGNQTNPIAVSMDHERLMLLAAIVDRGNDVDAVVELDEINAGLTERPEELAWADWSAHSDDNAWWVAAPANSEGVDFERYEIVKVVAV